MVLELSSPYINEAELTYAQELINFIAESPSAFHAVETMKQILVPQGFQELALADKWRLDKAGKYFVTQNNSALIAFIIGQRDPARHGFRIIAAHTDSPSFRIKTSPEISVEGHYLKLNLEAYGGPILNTWLDRPLSLAGRIILRGESLFSPQGKLFRSKQPLLVIPNLAIHMNRKINEGIELNRQKDMLPLLAQITENLQGKGAFSRYLAKELECLPEEILDFDLFSANPAKDVFLVCSRSSSPALVSMI